MGPQLGYYYPEIVQQMHLSGPGIEAQGVAVPGVAMYILIGRTPDYAWSLTSASHDVRDVFAEQLCNPDGSPPTRDVDPLPVRGRVPSVRDVRRRHAERHADPLSPIGARAGDRHRHRRRPAVRAHPPALDLRAGRPEPRRPQGHDRGRGRHARRFFERPTSSGSRSTGPTPPAPRPPTSRPGGSPSGRGPGPAAAHARHRRVRVAGLPAPGRAPARRARARRAAAQLEQPVGARASCTATTRRSGRRTASSCSTSVHATPRSPTTSA